MTQELEAYLKTFGNYLQPYAKAPEVTDELFRQLERSSAECTVSYGYHPLKGSIIADHRMAEGKAEPEIMDRPQ